MTQVGTVINDKYEILKEIGRGGMSVVYLAMDKHLNKQWAVKEIRKKGNGKNDEIVVNSLLAEANMMKKLDHPSLPRIVDIIDNGITIYVIMDYIEGESLDKILNEYGAQPEELVIGWAKQLCDALSYLHSQKPPIIYRDMKPANVMLRPEGNIKIIDFGIAREYKEQNLADTTVLGTKGYAPPEQYSGQTDARSDIYALGMTMHHLLTSVDPRNGEPYAPVRQWNPELSEGIEVIIDKCVQPAAENRYQSCADLLYDLEHPELITKDFKRKQKRKLWSFIAAVSFSVISLVGGFICSTISTNMNNNTYETLISVMESMPYEEKIASYKQAIELYPYDTRAYIKLLEAYEREGEFGKEQDGEIQVLYNRNKDGFDKASIEFAELNYKIGTMYFNYYDRETLEEGQEPDMGERVKKAHPFFESNHEYREELADYEGKALSETYYQICDFYNQHILAKFSDGPSKIEYDGLIDAIRNTLLDSVEGASEYEKLSLYNGTFLLLNDQRNDFASVDVEKENVLGLLETVYDRAKECNARKEQAKELRDVILENYENYREAIERAYTNDGGMN